MASSVVLVYKRIKTKGLKLNPKISLTPERNYKNTVGPITGLSLNEIISLITLKSSKFHKFLFFGHFWQSSLVNDV